jgi:hypothetical protein
MTSSEAYQKYLEAIGRNDQKAAAYWMRVYLDLKARSGSTGSKPTLVNLSTKAKTYPNAIPLDQIPDQLLTDPEFFEVMKRVGGGG